MRPTRTARAIDWKHPLSAATVHDPDAHYFRGEALYGDTLTGADLEQWFAEEAEGYADLGAKDRATYRYTYHALNWYHGFRHLPPREFHAVLGLGSAYGDELTPVVQRSGRITILDSSEAFVHGDLNGTPLTYMKPAPSGTLPFAAASFDLISCLGVLHHIPNVSHVVGELARVLAPGGYMLLREPIHSMGDWRRPRRGLTRHERGIPIGLLREMIVRTGLEVMREAPCMARLVQEAAIRLRLGHYNRRVVAHVDAWYSRIFGLRRPYHATRWWHRLYPVAVYYVLRKPG